MPVPTPAELIRLHIKTLKLNYREVGDLVGVTSSYVSLIASGRRVPLNDELFEDLAKVLGINQGTMTESLRTHRTTVRGRP